MTVKELKQGEFFTLRPIAIPAESAVYIRKEYDRSEGKYWCQRFDDISEGKYLKGDREVYTNFIF